MVDRESEYRRAQQRAHERTLARLRGEPVERTPEQQRADEVVDAILARGIERTRQLSEREKRALDDLWAQLAAEAAFTLPGPEQFRLLNRAARELVEREVAPDLGGQMLEALAASLGLQPQHVRDALAALRAP